jgi:hypothetical protein
MRAFEFISEGGWATTATQGTVITPPVVKQALAIIQQFVKDFNGWLADKDLPPVELGRPTGSTAYHDVDPEDKVYGDIDLQMIAPEMEPDQSQNQYSGYWNKLADEFVTQRQPKYLHPTENKIGHPIVAIGNGQYIQIDFMWHPPRLAQWGAARVTPERGVKGLLTGNMFSVLGELLDMSIQHAGVQLKVVDNNQRVPFSKRKDTQILTISIDPDNFILDIFKWLAERQGVRKPIVSKELLTNPGLDIKDVKIARLVAGVRGFAKSAEINNMFGQGDLAEFDSAADFMNKFIARYREKAEADITGAKRDKAATPDAIARADADRKKVETGLDMVMNLFRGK